MPVTLLLRKNWLVGLLAFFIVFPVVWMLLDNDLPFKIESGSTVPPQIPRGGVYYIDWVVTNYPRTCDGTTDRFAKDSKGKFYALGRIPASFGLIPAKETEYNVPMRGVTRVLDKDTALGPIMFWGVNRHYCNLLQRLLSIPIEIELSAVWSEVVEK
jgi:hypothetical protein